MTRSQRPHVRIDQSLGDHRRSMQLSPKLYLAALGLHVIGIGWCDRMRTDGFIPCEALQKLVLGSPTAALNELVRVGFWHEVDGGYQINDYLDWQDSAADIECRSQSARQSAQRRWGIADSTANGNAKRTANRIANGNATEPTEPIEEQERRARAREDGPDEITMPGDTSALPCLSSPITVTAPVEYEGTCWGFIVTSAAKRFGRDPSPSELAQLRAAIREGCLPDCDGRHATRCAAHIVGKLNAKGKGTFRASGLWLKCIREDRGEVLS